MFGIDIIDASLLPAMMISLVAGLLSFLSPCVLPIVPPYLAYMGGIGMHGGLGTIGPNVNEALIAGESFAQSVSQFHGGGMGDFLELKGMGDYRIPMQDIMGPGQMLGMGQGYPGQYGAGTYDPYHTRMGPLSGGGMGDWVEFTPGSPEAMTQFTPAMEAF